VVDGQQATSGQGSESAATGFGSVSDASLPQLPISRNQLRKLGGRLARQSEPSDADLALLLSVLEVYDEVLGRAKIRVDVIIADAGPRLGLALTPPTGRLKTTGTLIEKLRREPSLSLGDIQDVAGIRVVGNMTYRDQERVCELLQAGFGGESKPPRRRDRRVEPSSGYRAVHIMVYPFGLPVEIQVRTQGQQRWANVYERLADVWGRQIRYGEEPNDADAEVAEGVTRREIVRWLHDLSDRLDEVERSRVIQLDLEREADDLEAQAPQDEGALQAVKQKLADERDRYEREHAELSRVLQALNQSAEQIR
jgi:ppGpp synthetase/RelA/SpoT-type nucleotidyltranferase